MANMLHPWPASSTVAGNPAKTTACSPVSSMRACAGHQFLAEVLTCFYLHYIEYWQIVDINSSKQLLVT